MIRWIHGRVKPNLIGDEKLNQLWANGDHVILSFWHDQLFMMAMGYHGPRASVMISASKDGELIARTMQYFNIGSIRGSSTRGGRAAFKTMVKLGKEPIDLVFTPDGPKGPRHHVKDGVVQLARLTGRPVVPMAFACSHGHRFNSWDRFLLPFPWGRGVYSFGDPLYYDKNQSLESFRARVQAAMDANTLAAQEYINRHDRTAV
ncbi:MAG: lysophospholipid acyltransferase family protein [Deltaproteobacteria bacterium]|nr:lysophospholipid acyltransferase family protein [Deltaproteobacteria bacterium]